MLRLGVVAFFLLQTVSLQLLTATPLNSLVLGGCFPQINIDDPGPISSSGHAVLVSDSNTFVFCTQSASVAAGKIGVGLGVSGSVLNGINPAGTGVVAQLRSTDDITVANGPSSGIIRMKVLLDGQIKNTIVSALISGTRAESSFQYAFGGQIISDLHTLITASTVSNSGQDLVVPATVDLTYTGNKTTLFVQLLASVNCRASGIGESCSSLISAENSAKVTSAEVLDNNGIAYPDATIIGASGFDYRAGFQDAPEPTSLGLAGLGLLAVMARAWINRPGRNYKQA
jgi:hypothetical protein